MLFEQTTKNIAGHFANDLRAYIATTFNHGNHRRFVADVTPPDAALHASDVGFVRFDGSVKLFPVIDVHEGEANALAHEQG